MAWGRPFPKGKSGRPGGQTKAEVAMRKRCAELIADATDGGQEIVDFALGVMRGQNEQCCDPASIRWAAMFLANRLWGKAPLIVEVNSGEPAPIPDMRGLSIDELRRLAAGPTEAAVPEPDGDPPGNVH